MELELADKHVLITGGSKGIGLACAQGFIDEGARVTIVARDADVLDKARGALVSRRATAVARAESADLRDAMAAAEAVARAEIALGPVDILVNSAGSARRALPAELTPQHWRDAMDAKFFTYVNITDPLIKRMAERGFGNVLNIVGMGGKVAGVTHLAGGAANAALMLMTAGLAAAYGPKGIRVNAVNPTITLTDRMDEGLATEARRKQVSKEKMLAQTSAKMPLGRIASPEEVANAVIFLCSPRASYISGAILSIDGALTPMVV